MRRGGLAFQIDDVTVRFGDLEALRKVSTSIGAGEPVAVVGPSGAGKSTFLRLLNGQTRASMGDVIVDGRPLSDLGPGALRELRSRVGFVHQDLRLIPPVRVIKNVLAGRLGRWSFLRSIAAMALPSRAQALAIHELLERVGIGDKLYERTDRLSGGEQQRVAIARALYQEPRALLADEPIASVDPKRASAVLRLLTEVCREAGLTLVVSLHDIERAQEFFPRLIGLRYGRLVFDRPTSEVSSETLRDLYSLEGDRQGDRAGRALS